MAAAVVQADYVALGHLFELYDERNRLMRQYKRERLVLGSTGQIRTNPCLDAALRLDKDRRPRRVLRHHTAEEVAAWAHIRARSDHLG